jgi:hypothetical protein
MNKKRWIAIGVVVIALLSITCALVYYYYLQIIPSRPPAPSVIRHIFKAKEIYPTKSGVRECLVNMANSTLALN